MQLDLVIDYQQLADKVAERLSEKFQPQQVENKVIRGIRELASYLNISLVTAQKLKNTGKAPFFTIGNRVFFNSVEVDKAIRRR